MSKTVCNSRLEKGLKTDVYMFLIFSICQNICILRNTHSLLQVGDCRRHDRFLNRMTYGRIPTGIPDWQSWATHQNIF